MYKMVHNYYPNITILFYIIVIIDSNKFFQKKLNNFKTVYFDVISFFL